MGQHQIVDDSGAEDCRSSGRVSDVVPAQSCVACGAADRIVLGDSIVTPGSLNVCCARCGLLQVTGNKSLQRGALDEPATPPMESAAMRRRAEHLARVVNVKMADTVLALGLHDVALLAEFDDLFGIDGHVLAAHPEQRLPEGSSFRLHAGSVLDFRPGVEFDHIFATGVLERQHNVLDTLLCLRRLLKPWGRLTIEARNVLPDGEISEAAFFGENTTVCLSPNTLGLLLARAGFIVDQVSAAAVITLVARVDGSAKSLPRPFQPQMLVSPEQDGEWLVSRLVAYVNLQQLRQAAQEGTLRTEHLRDVVALLDVPAFEAHRVDCLVDIVQSLASQGAGIGARLIASSAAMNQKFPPSVRDGFARFADALA